MKIDFSELEKKMSTDKKLLQAFKNVCVETGQLELASNLRKLEQQKFPQSKDHDEQYELGQHFELVLRLVHIKSTYKTAHMILKTAEAYAKMGGKFDLKTASEICAKSNEIFGE